MLVADYDKSMEILPCDGLALSFVYGILEVDTTPFARFEAGVFFFYGYLVWYSVGNRCHALQHKVLEILG